MAPVLFAILPAALWLIPNVVSAGTFNPSLTPDSIIPNRYIVQFDPNSPKVKRAKRDNLHPRGLIGDILGALINQQTGFTYVPSRSRFYTSSLFNGASVYFRPDFTTSDSTATSVPTGSFDVNQQSLPVFGANQTSGTSGSSNRRTPWWYGTGIPSYDFGQRLAQTEGVQNVWHVHVLRRSAPVFSTDTDLPLMTNGTDYCFTGSCYGKTDQQHYVTEKYPPHMMTGVDKLHKMGITGKGTTVVIIDHGVDYKNDILGGCLGNGCKVAFGKDYVGDNFELLEAGEVSDDPYEDCAGHGTHVTGIVGAAPNKLGFSGVAPDAKIGVYRVYGCTGNTEEDIVLQAYLDAVEVADIINMSNGVSTGFSDNSPISLVILAEMATKRTITVGAVGNFGNNGLFLPVSPGSTRRTIGVGSVDQTWFTGYNMQVSDGSSYLYMNPIPFKLVKSGTTLSGQYPIIFTSLDPNAPNDACDAFTSDQDFSNTFVFVVRGGCTLGQKYANVGKAKALGVLIYNNNGQDVPVLSSNPTGPRYTGLLRREDGLAILNKYKSNRQIKVSFDDINMKPWVQNTLTGGLQSDFTEFGPTFDLRLTSSISGPGGYIVNTVPRLLGTVGTLSGTSMAAPYISGSLALLRQARPADSFTVDNFRGLLMTTANFIPTTINGSTYETVARQGAGFIQLDKAADARTIITPPEFLLNDTRYANLEQTMRIRNTNSYTVTYRLSFDLPAQTICTFDTPNSGYVSTDPEILSGTPGAVGSRSTLVVLPYASIEVAIRFRPPYLSENDQKRFPVYSGFVQIVEEPTLKIFNRISRTYSVPFLGVVGSMLDFPVFDTTPEYKNITMFQVPFLGTDTNIAQTGPWEYPADGGPVIVYRQTGSTRVLTIDLVSADVKFEGTIPSLPDSSNSRQKAKRDIFGGSLFRPPAQSSRRKFSDTPTIGRIQDLPNGRARDYAPGTGRPFGLVSFADRRYNDARNGTTVLASVGVNYRVLLRALKVTGDPQWEDQYESWLSPPFSWKE